MNALTSEYFAWAVLLSIKMLLMHVITTIQNLVNTEDCNHLTKANEPQFIDANVEHVRRAHLNEVESILTYIIIGGIYSITIDVEISRFRQKLSIWILRIACFSRIYHTLVYAFGLFPQSYRFLGFAVSYFINIFMALEILITLIFGCT